MLGFEQAYVLALNTAILLDDEISVLPLVHASHTCSEQIQEDKWENIILVGTKRDRATPDELDLFGTDRLDEDGQPVGIAAQFFAMAPNRKGPVLCAQAFENRM